MNKRKVRVSNFVCLVCKKMGIPIQRHGNKIREKGHIKDLHCVHCNKITQQMELRDNDSDIYEYNQNPEKYIQEYAYGRKHKAKGE